MKSKTMFSLAAFFAASVLQSTAAPADDVKAAAKKLTEKGSYSWKQTSENAGGGGGGGGAGRRATGPTEGKTTKEGITMLTMTRGESNTVAYVQGAKGSVKTGDGWKSLSELSESSSGDRQNAMRFISRGLSNYKTPAVEAEELAGKAKELKKTDDTYSGDLTEDAVKTLLSFGGRGGNNAAAPTDAKGTVKFWVKDGVLTKYQYNVKGKMTFNDNTRDIDRTTTVEIKDVGTTKVEVPEEAKKKLG